MLINSFTCAGRWPEYLVIKDKQFFYLLLTKIPKDKLMPEASFIAEITEHSQAHELALTL